MRYQGHWRFFLNDILYFLFDNNYQLFKPNSKLYHKVPFLLRELDNVQQKSNI
jgi:hypothetical protein